MKQRYRSHYNIASPYYDGVWRRNRSYSYQHKMYIMTIENPWQYNYFSNTKAKSDPHIVHQSKVYFTSFTQHKCIYFTYFTQKQGCQMTCFAYTCICHIVIMVSDKAAVTWTWWWKQSKVHGTLHGLKSQSKATILHVVHKSKVYSMFHTKAMSILHVLH